jgi:hypothetical protein
MCKRTDDVIGVCHEGICGLIDWLFDWLFNWLQLGSGPCSPDAPMSLLLGPLYPISIYGSPVAPDLEL